MAISNNTVEIVVRVRRISGFTGEANYYHHADIICNSKAEALAAAREGRVHNWRLIDKFDICEIDYKDYEVLYVLNISEAKNPQRPKSQIETPNPRK